jgi:hypothetical protein
MTSVRDQWAAAGVTTLTLPSGFRVRGIMPNPSEIIRRKIIPQGLRVAVLGMQGRMMSDLDEDEHAQLIEARRYQIAAFVRAIAPPGTEGDDGWEPITLTLDDLSDMPSADIERLDDLIGGYQTAEQITARSEYALGLATLADIAAIDNVEAGDTVDGWRSFRGVDGSDGVGTERSDVAPTAVGDDRRPKPVDGVPRRRRTRSTARNKGTTDDRPGAAA